VLAKTLLHLLLEHGGLGDHLGDHRDKGGDADGVDLGQAGAGGQLLGAERGHDLGGAVVQVALPPRRLEQRRDPGHGEPAAPLGVGSSLQDRERVPAGQVPAERLERARVELAQQRP